MTDMSIEQKRAALREQLLRQRRREQAARDEITPVARTGPLPLSRQQESVWLAAQVAPELSTYNMPVTMRLRGPLDPELLRAALAELTARHESLRTSFTAVDGTPLLLIEDAPGEVWFERADLTGVPERLRWPAALSAAHAQIGRPFDLRSAPLLRAWLARLAADDHVFQLIVHHVVCDGWSLPILARELSELYNAARAGRPAALAPLPLQPVDVDAWQRARRAAGRLDEPLAYWRAHLAGLPPLRLPAARSRPATATYTGNTLILDLPPDLVERADAQAGKIGVSPFAVLLACFATVLRDHCGQDDLAIGTGFSGRFRTEMEPMVGFFANTHVLRVRNEAGLPFSTLIERCQDVLLDAQQRQDVPFAEVVDAVRPDRAPGANPLFQVCLTLARAEVTAQASAFDGVTAERLRLDAQTGGARFDLTIQVTQEAPDRWSLHVEYSTELFDRAYAVRIAEDFRDALDWLVPGGAPDGRVRSDVQLDAAAIRQRLAELWMEVFEVEPGAHGDTENFFEIGGTSMKAVWLRVGIEEAFGVNLDLAEIYAGGSIAELTAAIEQALEGL